MRQSSWKFYSVKLVYQYLVSGQPTKPCADEIYSDNTSFFEESIVLVKAQSFQHAYRCAEKLAQKNSYQYTNIYGQQVEYQLVDSIDCYELFEEPKSGIELYSMISTVSNVVSAKDYLEQQYGYVLGNDEENEQRRRYDIKKGQALLFEGFWEGLDEGHKK